MPEDKRLHSASIPKPVAALKISLLKQMAGIVDNIQQNMELFVTTADMYLDTETDAVEQQVLGEAIAGWSGRFSRMDKELMNLWRRLDTETIPQHKG
jgi:hypothetical protein